VHLHNLTLLRRRAEIRIDRLKAERTFDLSLVPEACEIRPPRILYELEIFERIETGHGLARPQAGRKPSRLVLFEQEQKTVRS
jgi:hypothetical protein